jgi:hypothetical protein
LNSQFLRQQVDNRPPMCAGSFSSISIANTAVGVILGIFIREIWEFFRRPALHVSFDEHDEGCKAHTAIGDDRSSEGFFIRAKVVNSKRRLAKSCRAFLVDVEQRNARGEFVSLTPKYDDSLSLTWSSQPGTIGQGPIDVPAGVSQYVDIVSTDKRIDGYRVHALIVPFRYGTLLDNKPKVLRFTILVTGDDVKQDKIKVIFDWRGQWNTFEVAKG